MSLERYEILDKGSTATVFRIPGTQRVCKSFFAECRTNHFPVEVEAYERFQASGHLPTILEYYGVDEHDAAGIVLQLAEKGDLYSYIWDVDNHNPPYHQPPYPTARSPDNLYRWAQQAAEGLAFAHSCGVLHSDIHCVNFLLDGNLNLKVADFAGASIDGGKSWSSYRYTHCLPGLDKKISTASEIFALGSALYYMVTGHDIFPELHHARDRAAIVQRLRDKDFPETDSLPALGTVIRKCWNLEYESMMDVEKSVKVEALQRGQEG